MDRSREDREDDGARGVWIGGHELAALVFQSILLAASLGFMAAVVISRLLPLARPLAFGLGLELGLLASYPTMRIVARANGTRLGFGKWILVTLVPSVLGVTLLSIL